MSAPPGLPAANEDEPENDDFLDLDVPERRHRTYGRLGMLGIGASAALLLVSLALTLTLAGNLLDLVVLVLLLGSACLGFAGLALLCIAGIKALIR